MNTVIPVLDKGFVGLEGVFGSDDLIVQSARVSYGTGLKGKQADSKLIRYLMEHEHWSPFEMPTLLFHLKMPLFIARQVHRHRTASINEVSARYTQVEDEFYVPKEWRAQAIKNKQGSEGLVEDQAGCDYNYQDFCEMTFNLYTDMLNKGVAREMARMVLPQSTYTRFYWKMDLRNLFNFLKLRLDDHAQWEVREYAKAIGVLTKQNFPMAYSAFEDYVLLTPTMSPEWKAGGSELCPVKELGEGLQEAHQAQLARVRSRLQNPKQ